MQHALHEHGATEWPHGQNAFLTADSRDEPAIDESAFAQLEMDWIELAPAVFFAIAG